MPPCRLFPIFLDLRGRLALVIGDGEAASRKAEALRQAGATVRTAPRFAPALLDGCAIAIGADAPDADLQALSAEAQARGIPVNIVDRPALCSYITPSVIDRDPITIAVSSGGAAPVLARLLRARIEAGIAPAYGRLAALADRFKDEIRPPMARRGAAPPHAGAGARRPGRRPGARRAGRGGRGRDAARDRRRRRPGPASSTWSAPAPAPPTC